MVTFSRQLQFDHFYLIMLLELFTSLLFNEVKLTKIANLEDKERERLAIERMVEQARVVKRKLESGVDKLLGTMKREDGYLTHVQNIRK